MLLILNILILLFSFYILAVVTERYFINSLDIIAQKWKMNSDMAGATLMAVGSSAPELFISLFALFSHGNESIGAGTIVGSAIFNMLVIIGASSVVRKNTIAWQPVLRDLIFYTSSVLLLLFSFRDGVISLPEVVLFLLLYIIYIFVVVYLRKVLPYHEEKKDVIVEFEKGLKKEEKKKNIISNQLLLIDRMLDNIFPNIKRYWLVFLISIIFIMGLSWILVQSAISISIILHIPAVIIGLTVLAIGTSVPDFISSIIVAKQGRGGMAISSAVGSNIFNILIGLGLPWFILLVFSNKTINVVTKNLNSSVFLLLATVIIVSLILILKKWKINKKYGYILIVSYILYLLFEVMIVILK